MIDQVKIEEIANYTGDVHVLFECKPNNKFSIRPVMTTKGEILEYQLLLDGEINPAACLQSKEKPEPRKPVMSMNVIRFHPDDVKKCSNQERNSNE